MTQRARGTEIWPLIPTKQPCLTPRGFLSERAILRGGKAQAVPGKHAIKVGQLVVHCKVCWLGNARSGAGHFG